MLKINKTHSSNNERYLTHYFYMETLRWTKGKTTGTSQVWSSLVYGWNTITLTLIFFPLSIIFFSLPFTWGIRLSLYRPRKGIKSLSTCNYIIGCLCGTKFVVIEVVFFLVSLHVSLTSPQVVLVCAYKTRGLVPVVLFWQTRTQRSCPMACSTTRISVFIHGHTLLYYFLSFDTHGPVAD